MAVENLVDAYYTLHVSTDALAFDKVKQLQKCDPATSEKRSMMSLLLTQSGL